jgi:hypothetical protein
LNKFFATRGEAFPLNDTVRAVDDSYRTGIEWLRTQQTKLYDELKDIPQGKMKDMFEWLSLREPDRAQAVKKFQLNEKEIKAALEYEKWEEGFRLDTGINGKEYRMAYYPQLQKNGFNVNTVKEWPSKFDEKAAGFWEKEVRGGENFDPQDNHLGRFANFLLDQGIKKKFTTGPIKELEKLINRQTTDGKYILPNSLRGPLVNYTNYMKGYPDQTQQAMNSMMGRFQEVVSNRLQEINKFLPEKYRVEAWDTPPQQTINRFMLFSYAAGLAGRPAANARDLMQGLVTGMTVIGPKRYWGAVNKLLSDRATSWDKAEKAGALLSRHNIGELWGDIYQEIPTSGSGLMNKMTKISNTLLQPQRWTDNFNRAVLYNAEKDTAVEGLRLLRARKIDARQFIEDYTTLWWNDEPNITRMLDFSLKEFKPTGSAVDVGRIKMLDDIAKLENAFKEKKITPGEYQREMAPLREKMAKAQAAGVPPPSQMEYKGIVAKTEEEYLDRVSDKIANELIDLTMWPYRKGGQPAVLRTGLGRVFGQYGMYPLNYLDFMRRGVSKMGNPSLRGRVAKTMALWAAVNYGAVEGMEQMGAETSQWFWASPGAYTGSPNMQFTQDLLQSMESSEEGQRARSRVLRYPLNFIPLNGAMRNMILSTSEESGGEGLLSPAVIRVLGLRPLKEEKDKSWEEELTKELGLAPAYRR